MAANKKEPKSDTKPQPPIMQSLVPAGFPSPASDYAEAPLDLNELLIKHPAATFFVRCAGDSMTGAGIFPGDTLVVDRSLEAQDGSIVIAILDGDFTVKRLRLRNGCAWLAPENPAYKPIKIGKDSDFRVWGLVTASIRQHVATGS